MWFWMFEMGDEAERMAVRCQKYARSLECSPLMLADSYKAGHFQMYPPAEKMTAYGEFRESFKDIDDDRIVVYGLQYYIDQFVTRLIKEADLDDSENFYSKHGVLNTQYPFPK